MLYRLSLLLLFSLILCLSCSDKNTPTQSNLFFKDPPGTFDIQVTKVTVPGQTYPSLEISFSIPEDSYVNLKVLNVTGFQVRELINDQTSAGTQVVSWDTKNDDGQTVGEGIYVYYLKVNELPDWIVVYLCKDNCDDL